ncbi:pentapeptide repeat-containing protein [Streptomyces fructofermentans]|uniref:pentapeptide repeat-containing protein n=1 Tax=Streptomyces fructofermentans TaxID=152141 RepID=UPI0033DDE3B5
MPAARRSHGRPALRRPARDGRPEGGAVLRGAALREALLCGADLSGADLRGADLTGSDPSGARWSVDTHWPFEQSALRRLSRPSGEAGGFVLPDPRTSPRLRRLLDGTG